MKSNARYEHKADAADAGRRLDVFVAENFEGLTRSAAQKLIASGGVTVNGKISRNNYPMREGDAVECEIPPTVPHDAAPQDIPLKIVYEDEDLAVVDKPRGMVVHPAAGHWDGTLVNALLHHCGRSLSGINGEARPGIVHRIDKDTSGLLVAAKNDAAHQSLAAQLAAHSMTRVYTAICHGSVKEDSLIVDLPIARHPRDRKKMTAVTPSQNTKSRRAVTHIKVLERFKKFTLIEARLETGRTHQIRVHMSHINHPLLGDKVYGAEKQPFGLEGQMLHAGTLGFIHPRLGSEMLFNAEPPEYFMKALEKIKRCQHIFCGASLFPK